MWKHRARISEAIHTRGRQLEGTPASRQGARSFDTTRGTILRQRARVQPRRGKTMGFETNGEKWREASAELYGLIWQSVRDAGAEILQYNADAVDVDDVADAITEHADGLVPVYYGEQVREWYALGLPSVDEFGLGEPSGDIFRDIQGALFGWYHGELWRVVEGILADKAGE